MGHVRYADDMTMQTARDLYFEVNGFGADGGYNDAWVDFKLGPIPMPFPNTRGRIAAVKFHDLHHVLTGYDTNTRGEFEISAWEIGAGCTGLRTAWVINLGGLASGVVSAPLRTFRAYARGRRSHSLYGEPFEPLLDQKVGDVRARHIGKDEKATLADVVSFSVTAVLGVVVGLTVAAALLPLVPVGLVTSWQRRRRDTATATA